MIKLQRPTGNVGDYFDLCLQSVSAPRLGRLNLCRNDVVSESVIYETNAAEFKRQKPKKIVADGKSKILKTDMSWLYTNKLASTQSPVRYLYDDIRKLSKVCPFCEKDETESLDHHLSKSEYPLLAVTPLNLVPACLNCNKKKYENTKPRHTEEPIHPYFDNPDQYIWLNAEVVQCPPVRLEFSIKVPCEWTEEMTRRMKQQFEILELARRLEERCDQFLIQNNGALKGLHEAGGTGLQEHLMMMEATNRKARMNSWIAAAYSALLASAEYCSGAGFQ